jgi:hypothetical protein
VGWKSKGEMVWHTALATAGLKPVLNLLWNGVVYQKLDVGKSLDCLLEKLGAE